MKVVQSCPTLCDPMNYTIHGILQARIPEWIAVPFSRRSSQPRDQTQVSHIAGRFFTSWATRGASWEQKSVCLLLKWWVCGEVFKSAPDIWRGGNPSQELRVESTQTGKTSVVTSDCFVIFIWAENRGAAESPVDWFPGFLVPWLLDHLVYCKMRACMLCCSAMSSYLQPMDSQASLFMEFSRREYWIGLPFPPSGDLPNPGVEPMSPALAGRLFTTESLGKPCFNMNTT